MRNGCGIASALLCILCLTALAEAEKVRDWEMAKVISQKVGSDAAGAYAAPIGSAVVAVPIYRRWSFVVVETEHYRYQWQERPGKTLIFNVNEFVRFYRDGDWFVVLDSKNNKHKFALVSSVRK